jgi:hypothetical protein
MNLIDTLKSFLGERENYHDENLTEEADRVTSRMPETQWPSDGAILEAFSRLLWGDLYDTSPSYPFSIWFSSLVLPHNRERLISLVIRVQPHQRRWAGKTYPVRGHEVVVQRSIPERDLYMMPVEEALRNAVFQIKADLPKSVAPRLFEADPRIGNKIVVGEAGGGTTDEGTPHPGSKWLSCPLLDPPGGIYVPFPKPPFDFPRTEQHYNRWTRCGKCQTQFSLGEEVVWGGGYLLWVCRKCSAEGEDLSGVR